MTYTLILLALIAAIMDWVAVAKKLKTMEYIFKPAVMVLLLIWIWLNSGFQGQMLWFGLGVFFSMLGDIFLMLPKERFIAGLVAFLLAHIFYIVGFGSLPPSIEPASLIIALFIILAIVQIYRRIASGLKASGNEKLKLPVLIYSIVISLMLYSALLTLTQSNWPYTPSILVSIGALLFFLSDTFLAWNKFVKPLPYGRLRVIIMYHLGQILLIVGAALQFSTH